ncbi:hypothetical protein niasHT_022962 [Heterodera trifolii]|uniref:MUN domain-containing protein n=1 Tax=Heterodera trifolii TaxID=157864 RepID=A0ABD2KPA6_9BILA
MDILRNAYNRDKADNFPQTSEHTKFSNSVLDVFTQLNEALKVLKQTFAAPSQSDTCGADTCGEDICGADICGATLAAPTDAAPSQKDICGADTCGTQSK